jgi:hypothetical protein
MYSLDNVISNKSESAQTLVTKDGQAISSTRTDNLIAGQPESDDKRVHIKITKDRKTTVKRVGSDSDSGSASGKSPVKKGK